ncbi:MAG: DUF5615 family PIN-like protein [Candidatus Brocadiales bacterium]
MKVLTDHDVYKITVDFLKRNGHDVVTAKELGLQESSDKELLEKAKAADRLLVTRDKDFGAMVFLRKELCPGVIYLKVAPPTVNEVHKELQNIFGKYAEKELKTVLCVVEPHRYRIRRIE